jgi:hypothetical protein
MTPDWIGLVVGHPGEEDGGTAALGTPLTTASTTSRLEEAETENLGLSSRQVIMGDVDYGRVVIRQSHSNKGIWLIVCQD